MRTVHVLSHADATVIVNAIGAKLDADKLGATVAVVDPHGELIALLRTDGCALSAIDIAINKAFTAARQRQASAQVGEASRQENFPMTNFGDLRYVSWGGGIPVVVNDEVVGAVGVSGLPEADDIALAVFGAGLIS
jgi:glc operon protein GlcG